MGILYKTYEFFNTLNLIMWYALIIAAILFCTSSLDDLFFDVVHWIYRLKKKLFKEKEHTLYYEELASLPEKRIALLVPCWHEAEVIQDMLKSNLNSIYYENYDLFVGVYPNDPETILEVEKAQAEFSNLYYVVNSKEGPTTKADNLNGMYHFILNRQDENKIKYDIFILHDAEDIIHPLSFKLYNYAIDQFDMIQTPVLPLEVPLFDFTHWVYNDEFAEMHLNSMIVRGLIHGLVPSAGVGTAFSAKALSMLAQHSSHKMPFSLRSVTEDYDAALRIQQLNLKTTFFPFSIARVINKKKWFGWGPSVPIVKQQLIATRSLFPTTYFAAVKQRTRWVYGITLQEWAEVGWPGTAAIRFTLFHDRKAVITNFLSGFGYIILLYWLISYVTDGFYYYSLKTLPEFLDNHHWVIYLIIMSFTLMLERIISRAFFTGAIYGFWPGILSIPRIIYANFINIHTSYAAIKNFILVSTQRKKSAWIKTIHTFPSEAQMKMYQRKIGDIMLDKGLISTKQLRRVIVEQKGSQDKIGDILLQYGYVNLKQLTELLAQQNNLDIVDANDYSLLEKVSLKDLTVDNYEWLLANKLLPIALKDNLLTIAITDPSRLSNGSEIQKKIAPYQAKFVMISLAYKLGDVLLTKGLISPQQIAAALVDQVATKEKLGSILVRKGYIKKEELTAAVAEQYNLNIIDLRDYSVLTHVQLSKINLETYKWLIMNNLKPIEHANNVVLIALSDPTDEQLRKKAVKNLAPYEVKFVMASP